MLAQAKGLPYGGSVKVLHCGSSPAARLGNSNAGISLHCFRCGEHLFEPHGQRSAAEILAARNATEALSKERCIPKRGTPLNDPSVPSEALIWTLRAGLMPEVASTQYGFQYDPVTRRVCIPLDGGFIARAVFSNDQPKYLRAGSTEQSVWNAAGVASDLVVVVEDILSAIKVRRAGFNSLAILGTSVSSVAALEIGAYNKVVGWLDNDKAGHAAYKKLRGKLALYETEVRRVTSTDDPKYLNSNEISEKIKEISWTI